MAVTGCCWSCLSSQSPYTTNMFMGSPRLFITTNVLSKMKLPTSLRVRASSGGDEEKNSGNGLSKVSSVVFSSFTIILPHQALECQ